MTISTLSDAVGATKVLYTGRNNYLFQALDWWCQYLGPDRPLQAVSPDDIDAGIGELMAQPALQFKRGVGTVPGSKKRSPATINRYVGALGTMYRLLRLHRRLPRSFVSPIVKGLKLPEPAGRTLTVSLPDVHRLIAAARLSRNRKLPALLAVACTTGLRKSNIQELTWGQIDLKGRTIDVARTKNSTPTRSVLPQWAAAELSRIRPHSPEPHWEVFGKHDFKRAWAYTLQRAEIPGSEGWTIHSCRHIAASILAQSGASLPVIMSCLNHKTTSMALRYSHLNTKALSDAMASAWS